MADWWSNIYRMYYRLYKSLVGVSVIYLNQGLLYVKKHLHITVHPGGVLEIKPTPGVE